MMEHTFRDLLKSLMSGKITAEKFRQLKENLNTLSDKSLDLHIMGAWNEIHEIPLMDQETKSEVLAEIHEKIGIPNRNKISPWMKTAAAILLPVLISLGSYFYFSQKNILSPVEFIVMSESGQKSKIQLPDGTQVWLNSDSKLYYSSDFGHDNRKVKLEGEAYFEVKKNSEQNFIVETDYINVVVHGTAFNVAAYEEDLTLDVSLANGKVGIHDKSTGKFMVGLQPDQQFRISKNDLKYSIRACDAQMESLWTQNKLKFENTPATEVFRKLERWYGVKIDVKLPDKVIYYGFTLKSESLREMLDEINKITPINYKINGEEVHIIYK